MTSRRSWRGVAIALAVPIASALALSACSSGSSGGSASTDPNAPVTITLGIQTQTNQKKPYSTMVAEFEKQNPNIKVTIVETPNADYANVIKTQFQGGNAPDVLYGSPGSGNPNSLLPYADAGYLLPLTDEAWATKAVPESAKTLYYKNDQLWALPLDVAPIPLVLNADAYKELGLKPATTLDELVTDCATAQSKGKNLIQLAGSLVPNTGLAALQIAASRVYAQDPQWNQERADGKVTFANTPGWKETLETFSKLKDANCFQKGVAAGTFDDLFSAVAQGKAASLFAPAGVMSDLNALNAKNTYAVAPFPGDTADQTFLFASPSNALGINAKTKYPDASKKLLEFFASPATQDAFAELSGNVSLRSVLEGKPAPAQFAGVNAWLVDPKKNAPLANLFWPNGEIYNQLGTGVQGILTGQATPDQVLKAMDDAWGNG